MRYLEIIAEGLGPAQPFTWTNNGPTTYVAAFTVDGIGYWVKAYRTRGKLPPNDVAEDIWVLNFGIDTDLPHRSKMMKPTDYGKPYAVLSTVFVVLNEFVERARPDTIYFSATDGVRGRDRLYQRFANHLKGFGYAFAEETMQFFRENSLPIWVLRAIDPKN